MESGLSLQSSAAIKTSDLPVLYHSSAIPTALDLRTYVSTSTRHGIDPYCLCLCADAVAEERDLYPWAHLGAEDQVNPHPCTPEMSTRAEHTAATAAGQGML